VIDVALTPITGHCLHYACRQPRNKCIHVVVVESFNIPIVAWKKRKKKALARI